MPIGEADAQGEMAQRREALPAALRRRWWALDKASIRPGGEQDTFATEFLQELAVVDDLFRYPRSGAQTLEGIFADVDPLVNYEGDATRPDEASESGAERRYRLTSATGSGVYVYETPDTVWLDVGRLPEGGGGNAFYAAVANYALNTGRQFIGDPAGLSDIALRRRTDNMLSSALKFGTTAHLAPHPRQLIGDPALGVPALRWQEGDHLGNIQSLIDVSVGALRHHVPEIRNARYDFDTRTFRDGSGRRILLDGDRGSGQPGVQRGASSPSDGETLRFGRIESSFDGSAELRDGPVRSRAAGAGSRTLKRGILLNTLARATGREKPGLLERVLRQPNQHVAARPSRRSPDRVAESGLPAQ